MPIENAQLHCTAFLDYLQAECGLSNNTRHAYRRDLAKFFAFLGDSGMSDLAQVKAADISQFMRSCRKAGLAVSSIARALAAVRMFCRFLVIHRVLARDVSSAVDSPKKWNRLPTVLDDDGVRDLMAQPEASQDVRSVRDQAMIALLYATGMRASEIAGLSITDVNFNVGVIRVLGKGAKERIVPVAKEALDMVGRYCSQGRPVDAAKGQAKALFLSRSGKPLAREDVFRMINKYSRRSGQRANTTPHTLHHSFATQLLAHGADLRSVQEMLGHADIATTQIYTHVDANRLRAIHKKFHPRG